MAGGEGWVGGKGSGNVTFDCLATVQIIGCLSADRELVRQASPGAYGEAFSATARRALQGQPAANDSNEVRSVTAPVFLCAALLWARAKRVGVHGPLPPSPKPDPLIGNLRAMLNVSAEARSYRDWGWNSEVGRPGRGNYTAIIRYGEEWRFHRKLMHEELSKNTSEERWPLIERDSRLARERILVNPDDFTQELRRIGQRFSYGRSLTLNGMTGLNFLASVYGHEITSPDDSLSKTVKTAFEGFIQAAVVPNYLISTFPWLKYIPEWFLGATWKAKVKAWCYQKDQMLHVPYEWIKNKMSARTEISSMLSAWLKEYMYQGSTAPASDLEEHNRWVAGGMFAVSVLGVFIIAMAMNPDIQAKVQDEIDSVIVYYQGGDSPLAMPHAYTKDGTYKGYHIPKGAIIFGNIWAVSNIPDVYPEPDRFNPDRLIDTSVPEAPIFGFGCSGCLRCLISVLKKIREWKPNSTESRYDVAEILRQMLPFLCKFTLRSAKHKQIVRGVGA
ncbi:cytochrome P450 [Rhizoctonia solani]|nr:cytochrome P450 [Rhizoctonia solani]